MSVETRELTQGDWLTYNILSDFSGNLIRIAHHNSRKTKDIVKFERKEGIVNLVFCQDIHPQVFGTKLCWTSIEKDD